MNNRDELACAEIQEWLHSRESERTAWKKVSTLAAIFGVKRLTSAVKQRISDSLSEAGIDLEPSLDTLGPHDTVSFHLADGMDAEVSNPSESSAAYSDRLPSQIIVWDAPNIGEDDGVLVEQWLRCLKSTQAGDRQFIWEGSTYRGIVGLVTYSGAIRNEGVIEGWGIHTPFETTLSREALLANPATAERFGARGIKALQGSAIRLSEQEAEAIVDMLGGLASTVIPWNKPDEHAAVIPWTSIKGLPAEKFMEIAICQDRSLWTSLGLNHQPKQQVTWSSIGRVDLVCGNTVIEVKKAVTVNNGPAQIERYLGHLAKKRRVGPEGVRGILVQKNDWAVAEVRKRLRESPHPLELWSVDMDEYEEWRAVRVC